MRRRGAQTTTARQPSKAVAALERPAWLLRRVARRLQALRRLPASTALTARELARAAQLELASDRATLSALGGVANGSASRQRRQLPRRSSRWWRQRSGGCNGSMQSPVPRTPSDERAGGTALLALGALLLFMVLMFGGRAGGEAASRRVRVASRMPATDCRWRVAGWRIAACACCRCARASARWRARRRRVRGARACCCWRCPARPIQTRELQPLDRWVRAGQHPGGARGPGRCA